MAELGRIIPNLIKDPRVRAVGIPVYRLAARSMVWHDPPKVIALSMPKAGTHLMSRVLDMLPAMMFSGLHLSEEDVFATAADASTSEFDRRAVEKLVRRCRNGQYVTAHFPHAPELTSLLTQLQARPLVLLRDPRAVAVSYVHYVCAEPRHFHHRYYTTELDTFDERLSATLSGFDAGPNRQFGLRSLRSNIERYRPWIDSDVPLVRFEDLIGDRGGGTADAQLSAVQQISEAALRPLTESEAAAVAQRAFTSRARTFRKGEARGWVRAFSADHRAFCAAELDDVIETFGYPPTDAILS